jgi:hypothetical protein
MKKNVSILFLKKMDIFDVNETFETFSHWDETKNIHFLHPGLKPKNPN